MKPKDLRAIPEADLRQRVAEMRKELTVLRLKARQGAVEQPHRIRMMRRDIARMLTVLRESRPVVHQRSEGTMSEPLQRQRTAVVKDVPTTTKGRDEQAMRPSKG